MKLENKQNRIEIKDENVKILITKRNFNEKFTYFSLKQIHTDKFYYIDNKNTPDFHLKGDAIITDLDNFPIGVRTADCLPIFIYSKIDNIVAVVHSGWRSTAKKILKKVMDFMLFNLKIDKNNLNFVFGPCICHKCYEIKDDMKNAFISEYGIQGEIFFENNKFDLRGANINILKEYQIDNEKILKINKCTVCNNDEFFSFRKEKIDKRISNVICISD